MENDMLSSLLSDPESLQNAMKTVSDLLGGQPSAQTEPQSTYDPASEMMQKALPVIGRRLYLAVGLQYLILSIALGKLAGSLAYFFCGMAAE